MGDSEAPVNSTSSLDDTIILSALEAEELGLLKNDGKPRKLCRGLRYDLKKCMLETECVKIDKILPRKCLEERRCPRECLLLAQELFECKRQFIDMRKRFRGNRGY